MLRLRLAVEYASDALFFAWRDLTPWLNHRRRMRSAAFAAQARKLGMTPEELSAHLDKIG